MSSFQTVWILTICQTPRPDVMSGRALLCDQIMVSPEACQAVLFPELLRVHRDSTEGEMNGCIVAKERKTKQNSVTN
jgi:hypothetical protein